MVSGFSLEDTHRSQWLSAANKAFSLGLTPLTRNLVAQALLRWPEDEELLRFSEFLAFLAIDDADVPTSQFPLFLGYDGCLEWIRFAIDPTENLFCFGAAG